MSAPPTAISSTRISAGCSPACGWRVTLMARSRDPAFRADVLAGLAGADPGRPGALALRPARLGAVRGDHPAPRILSDPHRDGDAASACPARSRRSSGDGAAVVEFGSGSSAKTPILLRAVQPAAYVPIDISGDFLRESAAALAAEFPGLPVHPVEADFTAPARRCRPRSRPRPSSASSPARRSAISSPAARSTCSAR